jgi:hypothetical protein
MGMDRSNRYEGVPYTGVDIVVGLESINLNQDTQLVSRVFIVVFIEECIVDALAERKVGFCNIGAVVVIEGGCTDVLVGHALQCCCVSIPRKSDRYV